MMPMPMPVPAPAPAEVRVAPAGLPALRSPELETLLRQARPSAPDLAVLAARLERARVAARAAGAERVPRLDARASAGRMREPGASGEPEVHGQHRAGLDLSWEIDLWGHLARVREAAGRDAKAAAEDLRGAWLLLESEIVDTFVQLRLLEAAAPHHAARSAAALRAVELHQARAEAGLETLTSVHLARAAGRRVEADALANRRAVLQARQRLALLVGQGPEWVVSSGPAVDLPDLPPGADSSLVEARPDLRAAEFRLEAAASRVGEARAARLPRFSLTGAYGLASSELRDLARGASVTWSLLPSLSLPVLDGGRSRLRVAAAQAEAQEAQALFRQVQLRALHELNDAFQLLEEDRQALAHWTGIAHDTEALLASRRAERQAGRSGGLPLAEMEQEHQDAAIQVLAARRQVARTRVTLQRALGQPWLPDLPPPGAGTP